MEMYERERLSDEQPPGDEARPIPSFNLRDFIAEVGRAIRREMPPEAWVEATVLDVQRKGKAYALDLIEVNATNPSTSSELRCMLYAEALASISEELGSEFDPSILKGACAVLKVAPTFHGRYHLQGKVLGLNPYFVAGILQKQIAAIRERLILDRLLQAQSTLPEPPDITRIAVIHPEGSAGWSDVRAETERLERAGIAVTHSLSANFEGREACQSLCAALDAARDLAAREALDVVLLIRGGGQSSGLAALASEDVARRICQLPVPVVTGLGHARDKSLLDEVAWRSADTPSKAIGLVLDLIRKRAVAVQADVVSIRHDVERVINRIAAPALRGLFETLQRNVDLVLAQEEHRLSTIWQAVAERRTGFLAELDQLQAGLDWTLSEIVRDAHTLPQTQAADLSVGYANLLREVQARLDAADLAGTQREAVRTSAHALLDQQTESIKALRESVRAAALHLVNEAEVGLERAHAQARALSVDDTLNRGFVLAADDDRRLITRVHDALGRTFTLHFADGTVTVHAGDDLKPQISAQQL